MAPRSQKKGLSEGSEGARKKGSREAEKEGRSPDRAVDMSGQKTEAHLQVGVGVAVLVMEDADQQDVKPLVRVADLVKELQGARLVGV